MESSSSSSLSSPVSSMGWAVENGRYIQLPTVPPEILKFAASRNMSVSQVNGQRFLTPNSSESSCAPTSACEVFIGKLPLNCYEPELLPILEEVGPVCQLRLMMNFSGKNRGYAFAKFYTELQANLAVRLLNDYEIRKKHRIGVTRSVNNRRLLLSGIPKDKTAKEIYDELYPKSPGLQHVLIEDRENIRFACPKELQFAITSYEGHGKAAVASKKLSDDRLRLWGFKVHVGWADPKSLPVVTHYYNIFVLRVLKLPRDMSNGVIHHKFNQKSNWGVVHVKRHFSKVFIYFKTRSQAEMAKESIDRTEVGGQIVRVDWFNPMSVPFSREQRAVRGGTVHKSVAFIEREQRTITTLTTTQQPAAPDQVTPGCEQNCYYNQPVPPQFQVAPFYYNLVASPQPNYGQQQTAGYALGYSYNQFVRY